MKAQNIYRVFRGNQKNSLRVTVPRVFVDLMKLKPGDCFSWTYTKKGNLKLKKVKKV